MLVACTVSFNSSAIIENTIDALLRQTYPVDKIIIADNCSNETNKNKLITYLQKSPKIEIIWLKMNGGGAGGFYEAMKYAYDKYRPDWYWLMDDDAFPNDDCLGKLMDRQLKLKNVGFIAPVIWGIDNKKHQLYHTRKLSKNKYRFEMVSNTYTELDEVERLDADAFVGPLISSAAVDACGFPRAGFFLEGDDLDYTYRITRVLNGYLIKDAQINHKDLIIGNDINPGMWWKQYYSFRNPILFAQYNLSGITKLMAEGSHIFYAFKQIIKIFIDNRYSGYRLFRFKLLTKGLIDGIKKKEGIVVVPSEYKIELINLEKKLSYHTTR